MTIEINKKYAQNPAALGRIFFTPQVPEEDRAEEMDRDALSSIPADLRPVDVGHEEDERRGLTPGYSN